MFKMNCRIAVIRAFVALAIVASVATQLGAQQANTKEWTSQWAGSFGIDPFASSDGFSVSENFSAAIAKQWSREGSRLGFRTQLATGRVPTITTGFIGDTCLDCSVSRDRRFGELSAVATHTFRNNRSLRPYLLAGPALYGVRTVYSSKGVVIAGPAMGNRASGVTWSLGATAGAGLQARLFGRDFFIEQRIFYSEASTATRINGLVVHPLSIGVKF